MSLFRKTIFVLSLIISIMGVNVQPIHAGITLKVGVYPNNPLVFMDKETKKAKGLFIDVLEYAANEEGWTIEYVNGSWSEVKDKLDKEEIDLLVDVAWTEERDKKYAFNGENIFTNWAQVYSQFGLKIESIQDFQNKSVALIDDIYYKEFINFKKQFNIKCDVLIVKDYHEVFKLLAMGKIDVGIVNRSFGMKFGETYKVYKEAFFYSAIKLRYAFKKSTDRSIISALDKHIVTIQRDRSSVYYQSLDRWLGGIADWTFPSWIKYLIYFLVLMLLLVFVINLFLRKQVQSKSSELRSRGVELKMEKSGRKRVQDALTETEERFRTIFDHTQIGIILMNQKGKIFEVNSAINEILGYDKKGLMNTDFLNILHPDEMISSKVMFDDLLAGKLDHFQLEKKCVTKDKKIIWVNFLVTLFKNEKAGNRSAVCLLENITERKIAEMGIQTSLKEKEMLVKEIHLRVQKNLKVIDDLLLWQSDFVDNNEAKLLFKESRSRLQAMSLIHEIMHNSVSLYKLDFNEFVEKTMEKHCEHFNISSGRIVLKNKIEDIKFGINKSILTGLLINELIANSLKHAFPRERKGQISVLIQKENEATVKLVFSDNGIGLPVNFKIDKEKSIGMSLITTLLEQLEGEVDLNTDDGTKMTFIYKI